MGLMDKFKNLFTEEVEVEVEEEPIKKEVMQVEIPSPSTKKKAPKTEKKPVEKKEKNEIKQEEYQFPFFDDEDFHTIEKKEEKPKREKKQAYQKSSSHSEIGTRYKPAKEEKRVFKPTPIISPVYGILDKNYQKEDIKSRNTKLRSYYDPKEATVDEIRNKAYGTLEDDIETTLFGKNEDDYKPQEEKKEESKEVEKPKHSSDDLTDLLEAELSKEEAVQEEEKEEKPRKISDSELFSMIDSMYQKGDKND